MADVTKDVVDGKAVYGIDVLHEDVTLKFLRKVVDNLVKKVKMFEAKEKEASKKKVAKKVAK